MKDEIRTEAIPNCQCHRRIAQLESALEALGNELITATDNCPGGGGCRQLELVGPWDDVICYQCWIDWAMEEAKK